MDTEVPVLCMDWMPCPRMGGEVLAMGFANGCLKLASKTGRVERSIKDAHAGGVPIPIYIYIYCIDNMRKMEL